MAGLSDPGAMQGFHDQYALPFDSTVSEDGSLWTSFGVPFQGSWYLLDDDGTGEVVPHDLEGPQLADALDELLAT
jgi:hypothetical protein